MSSPLHHHMRIPPLSMWVITLCDTSRSLTTVIDLVYEPQKHKIFSCLCGTRNLACSGCTASPPWSAAPLSATVVERRKQVWYPAAKTLLIFLFSIRNQFASSEKNETCFGRMVAGTNWGCWPGTSRQHHARLSQLVPSLMVVWGAVGAETGYRNHCYFRKTVDSCGQRSGTSLFFCFSCCLSAVVCLLFTGPLSETFK